ncbi:hypothetical protein ES703_124080 [subsurface metagenome]
MKKDIKNIGASFKAQLQNKAKETNRIVDRSSQILWYGKISLSC